MRSDAIVVLGCRVGPGGRSTGAALRRIERAAAEYSWGAARIIVASGGRRWWGLDESSSFARALAERGVPAGAILRECASLSTSDNAERTARLLRARAARSIVLVTCDWHMARAREAFERHGIEVRPAPAASPRVNALARLARSARERVSRAFVLTAALSMSCRPGPDASPSPTPSASAGEPRHGGSRIPAILAAEHRRASAEIAEEDLSNRDVGVRRAAARALARIGDARAVELASKALADEDPEVVSWSAYGLGWACKGHEGESVRRLVVRAASVEPALPVTGDALGTSLGIPVIALSDALARCGSREAERTLTAWVSAGGERARHASLALGRLASAQKRLDDATIVALLDGASAEPPLDEALFPFTRLPEQTESVRRRLLEVATGALDRAGRAYAIRALGRAGEGAADALSTVLTEERSTPAERADAAQGLARMAGQGQKRLAIALGALAPPDGASAAALTNEAWSPVSAVLGALDAPGDARATLTRLASLPVPTEASKISRRRLVYLRCTSAALLAGADITSKALTECDASESARERELALLSVLARAPLRGARGDRWQVLATSTDALVRQRAIGLMPAHPEITNPHVVLTAALGAKESGTVASTADVLSAYPDRSTARREARRKDGDAPAKPSELALDPDPALVKALGAALDLERTPIEVEVRASLMDAAAALQLLSLKPKIEPYCRSDRPVMREHAAKALGLFGDRGRKCEEFDPPKTAPPELDHLVTRPVTVDFETESGTHSITLDPSAAPVTVTRVVDLVRARFYDGIIVHRVVPGFVAQFGDPGGDGYGGGGEESLRCETSPIEFAPYRVGVALGGRDTGSSQLFVMLGSFPHLDGSYPLIGTATEGFAKLAQGDPILKARVRE